MFLAVLQQFASRLAEDSRLKSYVDSETGRLLSRSRLERAIGREKKKKKIRRGIALFPYLSRLYFTSLRDLIFSSRRRSFLTSKLALVNFETSTTPDWRWSSFERFRTKEWLDRERRLEGWRCPIERRQACTYILQRSSRSSKNGKLTHLSSVNSVRVGSAVTVQLNAASDCNAAGLSILRDIGGSRRRSSLQNVGEVESKN